MVFISVIVIMLFISRTPLRISIVYFLDFVTKQGTILLELSTGFTNMHAADHMDLVSHLSIVASLIASCVYYVHKRKDCWSDYQSINVWK